MNIVKLLNAIAGYLERFVTKYVSPAVALAAAAAVIAVVALALVLAVLRSRKRRAALAAKRLCRYLGKHKVAGYADCSRLYNRCFFKMPKKIRREWRAFMMDDRRISDSGFMKSVAVYGNKKVAGSGAIGVFAVAIAVLLLVVAVVRGLGALQTVIYIGAFAMFALVMKGVVVLAARRTERAYSKAMPNLKVSLEKNVLYNTAKYDIERKLDEMIESKVQEYVTSKQVVSEARDAVEKCSPDIADRIGECISEVKQFLGGEAESDYGDFVNDLNAQ